LQAHRRQDDGTLLTELRVPWVQWRHATGLTTDRSDLIRRASEAAHEELQADHYLARASIEGRGKTAVAHYVFADRTAADPALVVMVPQVGVTVARAATLASLGLGRVEEALKFLEHRRKTTSGGVRNPGGLITDFLENPEKNDLPPDFLTRLLGKVTGRYTVRSGTYWRPHFLHRKAHGLCL
jgi:plasmid replication initiation protein